MLHRLQPLVVLGVRDIGLAPDDLLAVSADVELTLGLPV
jgi:hypothetical protein